MKSLILLVMFKKNKEPQFTFWDEMWNYSDKENENEKNTTEDSLENPSLGV